MPESVYKPDFYPPYCSGDCYVLSADVAKDIYLISLKTNVDLTFDDVVISGILREKVRRIVACNNSSYREDKIGEESNQISVLDIVQKIFHAHFFSCKHDHFKELVVFLGFPKPVPWL